MTPKRRQGDEEFSREIVIGRRAAVDHAPACRLMDLKQELMP